MQNPVTTHLLQKYKKEKRLTQNDIKKLLGISDPQQINQLFEAARNVREIYFGKKIFLYGFLYFSTHCRNNCRFCQYRQANKTLARYRKTEDQILAVASELADSGVHLIDMTMGEDPMLYSLNDLGFSQLISIIEKIQQKTGLPVMISPGVVPDEILKKLAQIGTTWYACYQETHNQKLYEALRPGQDYNNRIQKKRLAKQHGMLIEEGLLINVGESLDDLTDSIIWMKENQVDQARAMTFVPQLGTPMSQRVYQGDLQELITIAVMRLTLPDRLIPASLDVNGLNGLKKRLDAGANVVTSIVPPKKGLAGVANASLDIDDSRRCLSHILPILESCGLEVAQPGEYQKWIRERQVAKGALMRDKEKQDKKICSELN